MPNKITDHLEKLMRDTAAGPPPKGTPSNKRTRAKDLAARIKQNAASSQQQAQPQPQRRKRSEPIEVPAVSVPGLKPEGVRASDAAFRREQAAEAERQMQEGQMDQQARRLMEQQRANRVREALQGREIATQEESNELARRKNQLYAWAQRQGLSNDQARMLVDYKMAKEENQAQREAAEMRAASRRHAADTQAQSKLDYARAMTKGRQDGAKVGPQQLYFELLPLALKGTKTPREAKDMAAAVAGIVRDAYPGFSPEGDSGGSRDGEVDLGGKGYQGGDTRTNSDNRTPKTRMGAADVYQKGKDQQKQLLNDLKDKKKRAYYIANAVESVDDKTSQDDPLERKLEATSAAANTLGFRDLSTTRAQRGYVDSFREIYRELYGEQPPKNLNTGESLEEWIKKNSGLTTPRRYTPRGRPLPP